MCYIPDPNVVFPNEYKTSCFLKNGRFINKIVIYFSQILILIIWCVTKR